MEVTPKTIYEYVTENGKSPFRDWLNSLKDRRVKTMVDVRMARIRSGNLGRVRSVENGVHEIKIDYGPGYRIYFANDGNTIVVLLCGGDKRTQDKDIKTALKYWEAYKNEHR